MEIILYEFSSNIDLKTKPIRKRVNNEKKWCGRKKWMVRKVDAEKVVDSEKMCTLPKKFERLKRVGGKKRNLFKGVNMSNEHICNEAILRGKETRRYRERDRNQGRKRDKKKRETEMNVGK